MKKKPDTSSSSPVTASSTQNTQLLQEILKNIKEIKITMAQDQASLDAAIKAIGDLVTTLSGSFASFASDFSAAIAALQAKIGTNTDFTAEVKSLTDLTATAQTISDNLAKLDDQAKVAAQ